MIILSDGEKEVNKILHLFMIKVSERSGTHCPYLNIINAIYSNPVINIKLTGEKHSLEAFPL